MFTRPTTLLLICLAVLAAAGARADASLVVVGFDDLPALTSLLDEGRRRKEEVDGR